MIMFCWSIVCPVPNYLYFVFIIEFLYVIEPITHHTIVVIGKLNGSPIGTFILTFRQALRWILKWQ